jgi:hypothetical protein
MGGDGSNPDNVMDYITMATLGDATDFGDLNGTCYQGGSTQSSTRGILAGGGTPGASNQIQYITIASTGNGTDFGDLTVARFDPSGASSTTRAIMAGGTSPGTNTIDYVTIASTGDASDFGDLTAAGAVGATGGSNQTRAVYASRYTPSTLNTIDYIPNIASTSNASDFGDLNQARRYVGIASNGHGGLS